MPHRQDIATVSADSLGRVVQASMSKDDVPRKDAAVALGISERTLDRRVDIPKIHVGRRVFVPAWYMQSRAAR